jgi:pimeloyl-ACP methyl ester carboxylesterase
MTHEIYLIPGFFGFARLGNITYFHHVEEELRRRLEGAGMEVSLTAVPTLPTASIPRRVEQLVATVEAQGGDGPIHLIGHSTGGLDARLLVTPGLSIPGVADEAVAERVESVVSVATPHFGTPTAAFFDGLFGEKLLYVMSLATIYSLRFGRVPIRLLVSLVGLMTRLDDRVGLEGTVVDQFYDDLFDQFDSGHEAQIREFLDRIVADQSAIGQLTPGSIDLFNAAAADSPEVRYGCVMTRAPRPGIGSFFSHGLNPYKQASHSMFQIVHRIAGRGKLEREEVRPEVDAAFGSGWPEPVDETDSDGMVPTLSQYWGEVVAAVRADHLDVCGHFDDPDHDPPHVDWLVSGSTFRRPQFEALWGAVADHVRGG